MYYLKIQGISNPNILSILTQMVFSIFHVFMRDFTDIQMRIVCIVITLLDGLIVFKFFSYKRNIMDFLNFRDVIEVGARKNIHYINWHKVASFRIFEVNIKKGTLLINFALLTSWVLLRFLT